MDVSKNLPAVGPLSRRFWTNDLLGQAENRTAAWLYIALSFGAAALFAQGHAMFGAYPFAIAYLCAVPRRVSPALLGALCGTLTLGERGGVYAAGYALLILVRMFLSRPTKGGKHIPASSAYFGEAPALRVAVAFLFGGGFAVYELLVGGLSLASFAYAVSMVLLPPLGTLLYIFFFENGKTLLSCFGEAHPTHGAAAWAACLSLGMLSFTAVLSLRGVAYFGISLDLFLAVFFAFLYIRSWGGPLGGVAACLSACGTLAPLYLPAFFALVLCALFLARTGPFPMLAAGVAGGQAVAYLFAGATSVISFMPELLLSAVLSYPVLKNLPAITSIGHKSEARDRAAAQGEARRFIPPSTRMADIAGAMRTMGEMYTRLSSAYTRPGEGERRRKAANTALSLHCGMTADILADIEEKERGEWEEDKPLSRSLVHALGEMGVEARHAAVYGKRRRVAVVFGLPLRRGGTDGGELVKCLEAVCSCRFSAPVLEVDGNTVTLHAKSRRPYTVRQATACAIARGEEISGDLFSGFCGAGAYYYGVLADGMGSGRQAALSAGLCGAYLRQVLGAGLGKETALLSLNTLLCVGGEECAVGLDILEIDLYTGRACFLKSGAAVSYIKRGDSLFCIRAGTVPIGILGEADAEKIPFDLEIGDTVILLSDGIVEGEEDTPWLTELLTRGWEGNDEAMADTLLAAARRAGAGRDDMTVALLTLEECNSQ